MSLLHKLRTLVGALVHAPFAPRQVDLAQSPPQAAAVARPADSIGGADLEEGEPGVTDTDRVADLLVRRKGSNNG